MQTFVAAKRMGLKQDEEGKPIEKPDLLSEYERYEHWGWHHLPWPGAMTDQPWQLMYEFDCITKTLELQAALDRANEQNVKAFEATTGQHLA